MFDSIGKDISATFKTGNMLTKIIMINIAVFVITALSQAFFPFIYSGYLLPFIAVPGEALSLLIKPWTIITHMFVHAGLWHLIWNMLALYWFGRIVGDLIGDRHVLPLYIYGGLMGAFLYVLSYQIFQPLNPGYLGSKAIGASAAMLAFAMAGAKLNPDHEMRLLLIGPVKIKWIVLAIILIDLISIGNGSNTGGHIAHLGGMMMGYLYVEKLGSGQDLSVGFNRFMDRISSFFSNRQNQRRKSNLKVKYKAPYKKTEPENLQDQVDAILEKIKKKGYGSLSQKEKDILHDASKN